MQQRAIITGDLLRAGNNFEFHQKPNVNWFSSILRPPLEQLGFKVETLGVEDSDFPFQRLYELAYGQPGNEIPSKWAAIYDSTLEGSVRDLLVDALGNAIYFLFEASPSILRHLALMGQIYINFRVHPLRFGSDLIMALESNHAGIARRIKAFTIGGDLIAKEVRECRARWGNHPPVLPENAIVFLAQSRFDSSIILNGQFVSIDSDVNKLRQIVGDRVPFHKPHPRDPNEETISRWLSVFPSSQLLDPSISVYQIFTGHCLVDFVTISSGSAYEATLFGHRSHFVSSRNWVNKIGAFSHFSNILFEYWDPAFWNYALIDRPAWQLPLSSYVVKRRLQQNIAYAPGRLRETINFEWAPR